MKLGRLTPLGSELFSEYINRVRHDSQAELPNDFLSSSLYFEIIDEETEVIWRKFKNRFDLAKYIESLIRSSGLRNVENDLRFWEALTAFYFDLLCPPGKNKKRNVVRREKYVPQADYNRYYKHLLLGPYLVYRAHIDKPERAIGLLCKPIHIVDDLYENIAGRQERVTNSAVVEVATRLYFDTQTGNLKSGAGGKGAGSPRRLAAVLDQFDLTWHLYSATADEIMSILPKEFDKFAKSSA
jgi:hypothetical protein